MINLLPAKYKKELAAEKKSKIFLDCIVFIACYLFFVFVSIFLLQCYFSVEYGFQKGILSALGEKAPEVSSAEKKIKGINAKAEKVDYFDKKKISQKELLREIAAVLPNKMYLTELRSIKKDNFLEIKISGYAADDQALFELKENLEKDKSFFDISFPVSSWTQLKDIKVSDITFKRKFEEKNDN